MVVAGISLLVWSADAGLAASPAGPRLAVGKWSFDPVHTEVLTTDPFGGQRQRVILGTLKQGPFPAPFEGPAWSPDGSLIAFATFSSIYLAAPDGSGLRPIPHTRDAQTPVFSPDGKTVAFSRTRLRLHVNPRKPWKIRDYFSTTTWIVGIDGAGARRLTPWRNGLHNEPASFSPDGSHLALSRSDDRRRAPEAVLLRLDSGAETLLAREATDPVFSPDGSRVALISYRDHDVRGSGEDAEAAGELYVTALNGTGLQRLTRTHEANETEPSWDPSGQRIAYQRTSGAPIPLFDLGEDDIVMQINADGTCPQKLLTSRRAAFVGPAWQPGVGREAGRIAC